MYQGSGKGTRIARKEALPMEDVVKQYIRLMKLSSGLNEKRLFDAWDAVSGMSRYTVAKSFRAGTLFVSLSSSVVRNQLYFRTAELVTKINEHLQKDPLFSPSGDGKAYLRSIVLR